jgi:hypothetical protein
VSQLKQAQVGTRELEKSSLSITLALPSFKKHKFSQFSFVKMFSIGFPSMVPLVPSSVSGLGPGAVLSTEAVVVILFIILMAILPEKKRLIRLSSSLLKYLIRDGPK